MKIFIASDHAGFELKNKIVDYLNNKPTVDEIHDLGPMDDTRVDYPDFADLLCEEVKPSEDSIGILVCGSGQGMSLRANKHSHIRAALCWNTEIAKLSRQHNDANVLCLGSRVTEDITNFEILETFLSTEFEGGRHQARVEKINSSIV